MPQHICLICGADNSVRAFSARDNHYGNPGEWWIRQCRACESLFVEHPPDDAELAHLYPADTYYSYSLARHSFWRRLASAFAGYARRPHEPSFATPGRVLDFGCGAGDALLKLKSDGWECAGVEINPGARAVARQHGLDVRERILGDGGFAPESFDYVRANHSLEHVANPALTLGEMFSVLKAGGVLFIGVPTATSQNARLFKKHWWHITAPLHLSVPSTRGLQQLVERSGFEIQRIRFNGDAAGTAGSLQIWLNRNSTRRSNQGIIFLLKPLLIIGDWLARLQDAFGVGDKIEVTAVKPGVR